MSSTNRSSARSTRTATAHSRRKPTQVTRGRPLDPTSKAGIARTLIKRMKSKSRKEIIEAFQSKAGLTEAGSATYYQKLKDAA